MNKPILSTTAFVGKGGVGKSTLASALGLYLGQKQSGKKEDVRIIDFDGGHSILRIVGCGDREFYMNTITFVSCGLSLVVIEPHRFVGITSAQAQGWTFNRYITQFPAGLGLVAWADMLFSFFGAPTDVAMTAKFVHLVTHLGAAEEHGCKEVIIDVEPTAGLDRLLSGAERLSKSLSNLSEQSPLLLTLLKKKMPDVVAFLKGDYMQDIAEHVGMIERAVEILRHTKYILVCTPEAGPVSQTREVRRLVESFGGTVVGCVVNRTIADNLHEIEAIKPLADHNVTILAVEYDHQMHVHPSCGDEALDAIGCRVAEVFQI